MIADVAFGQGTAATERGVKTLSVEWETDSGTKKSVGEVIVETRDGSLLFLTPDGKLWILPSSKIKNREVLSEPMEPLDQQELFDQLKDSLPRGVAVKKTEHYVIVYNTSKAYADWVGLLFERLYRGFFNYWKQQHKIVLEEPRFPLVALVFNNKKTYVEYAKNQVGVGDAAESMIGFFDQQSNRMVSYDLTGVNGIAKAAPPQMANTRLINSILAKPQAERTVATIVHEAVHQIAYNSGLQVRLADNPRWLSEGLAMYFESPDLSNRQGWSGMGKINRHNREKFRLYLNRRPANSLATLIADDERLLNSRLASDAYCESWALTYFLMKTKKSAFKAYLEELAELPPLGKTDPKQRVAMFKKHFGDDLGELDQDFIKYFVRFMLRAR